VWRSRRRRGVEERDVDLVAGPLAIATPAGVAVHSVESTGEMAAAIEELLPLSDVLVMSAAPADFRPAQVANSKIKKASAPESIALAPTADILLATRHARRAGAVVVGFALETNDAVENGRTKLASKDLDLIVVNDATEQGSGLWRGHKSCDIALPRRHRGTTSAHGKDRSGRRNTRSRGETHRWTLGTSSGSISSNVERWASRSWCSTT
jgi:phosphopantothenoylcysteine decarboxylase/phosphopantothenate--cysteine ligase